MTAKLISGKTDPDDDADALDESALLLEDPQVRDFLRHYLAIPDAEGRAHLRRFAAQMASSVRSGDAERRRRLGLSPRAARRGVLPD